MLAAQVVIVEEIKGEIIKVYESYIKYPPDMITDYKTKYSGMTAALLSQGQELEKVKQDIKDLIGNQTLVTLAGKDDLESLSFEVSDFKHFDIQWHFWKTNPNDSDSATPCALGPLVEYYGYKDAYGKPVVIKHVCEEDAYYTLKLYLDHYRYPETRDEPSFDDVITSTKYREKHNLKY